MKWGVAWRNIKRYVKHDLKEIAFPSSLPDPPHVQAKPKPRKLTAKDYVYIVRTAASLHAKSFTRDGLTKEDWKKAGLEEQDDSDVAEKEKPAEPSSLEEIALAARAGAEHIKPALQRIYMTRASAYRDALKSFVEGYQEGVAEVMAKNSEAESAARRQRSREADEQTVRSSTAEEARKDKMPF
ncbi:hypothetical protein KC19_4G049700 [Ceratodon purpureus]|uniref:Uncharacterized protein n=1 Tax=Ceratodon purpureus TaxID=3225 RepID=A0A8T0I7Y2_CERPU|nr:hypothetical protein KC19_4G049700 [Ceratodon purpureus]